MPGMEIPPGFGQVIFKYALTDDPEVMTFAFGYETDFAESVEAEAGAINGAWLSAFGAGTCTSNYTFLGNHIDRNQAGLMESADNAVSVVGTVAASELPQNVALLVKKQTNLAGRAHRGRCYLPPFVGEVNVSPQGMIDAGTLAAKQGNLTSFLTAMAVADLRLFLLHSEGSALSPDLIVALTLDHKIATQRRRLR